MTDNAEQLVLSIVREVLGDSKYGKNNGNIEFNCPTPTCRKDHNKYNLTYNVQTKIFNCWKCEYRGRVSNLVSDYGTPDTLERLKIILPKDKAPLFKLPQSEIDYNSITCKLPKEYLPLNVQKNTNLYKLAWNYVVNERKITPAQIDKYQIGYTEYGNYKFRIIVPSVNIYKQINYFEARAYLKNAKQTYQKPPGKEVGRKQIIFNEYFINWDLPIYLVEGAFDAIRLPNAIPLLNKTPSPLIIDKLLKHKSKVIICLDSDAVKEGMEIYKNLTSLGLEVFFLDLTGYKDVSMIYEKYGEKKLVEVMKGIKKIDPTFEIQKILNE